MFGCSCLLSVVLIFHNFDGVLLQEHSRNVKYHVDDPTDEISLGGGGGWGLPDGVAVVGKIFRYQLLQHDDTCGNLTNYQVASKDNGDLPEWLLFNKTESTLEGVPGSSDSGQVHGIQVTATCTGSTTPIEEYFTVTVSEKEETFDRSSQALEFRSLKQNAADDVTMLVRCAGTDAVTTATVTIDADDSRLTSVDRLLMLRRLGAHLRLPETLLRLAANRRDRPVYDDGPLVAGPGDAKHPHDPGVLVQWDVGCGNVFADHMPVLQLLETASANGSLGAAVGRGVVGWDISSKRSVQSRSKRRVYFADPTATPFPSAERPSARPVPTAIVPDKDAPESRIVPTRTSAGVPGVTRTQSPPSRLENTSSISPAVRLTKSPTPTTTYVTITATRVLSSVTGTAVDPGATATGNATSPGHIEPSVVPEATARPGPTDILPTWTTSSSVTPSKLPTPRVTKRPPKTQKPTMRPLTTHYNFEPEILLDPLDDIEMPMGRQLLFAIPDDMFRDYGAIGDLYIDAVNEDGSTSDVPPNWIGVNRTTRTIYGLAFEEEHIGTHRLQLVAIDDQQRTIVTPFTVRIDPPPPANEASNQFSVTFDVEYDDVKNDMDTRMNLINKIAAAFGDKDAGKMTILAISPGSVVITYTNNTLPSDPCPHEEIEALLRYLLQPDGQINETFAKAMDPYRVLKAEGKATGSCASVSAASPPAPSVTSQGKVTTSTPENEVDVRPRVYKSESNLLYILLPLLIFFVLLVLIIIICIVCCKRQRKRQKEEDKLTGLHKGIPIIFAEELEEKPDTPASTLKSRSPDDEKRGQHVPPPEYPTWKSSGSGYSTLRSDYKSPLLTDNEDDDNKDSGSTPPETLPRRRTQEENAATTEPLLHFEG